MAFDRDQGVYLRAPMHINIVTVCQSLPLNGASVTCYQPSHDWFTAR
jgi:hypothetical protein